MKISKMKPDSVKHSRPSTFEKWKKPNLKIRSAKKYEKVQSSKAKPKPAKQNTDLTKMSVDDFMSGCMFDSDESDSENDEPRPRPSSSSEVVSNGKKQGKSKGELGVGLRLPKKKKPKGEIPKKGKPRGQLSKKGSSFLIDFEAKEEEEVDFDDDNSFINDESEDSDEATDDMNVNSFLNDEAKEDNTFDYGEGEVEDDSGEDVNGEDSGDEDDDNDDEDGDDANDSADKDYADVPDQEDENEDESETPSTHKKSLERLRATDPEFYKYLEANDKKLLQFQESDSEDDGRDTEKYHKPAADDLEMASDESDYEAEDGDQDASRPTREGVVSLKMVREWQAELQTSKAIDPIANAVQAFHAALNRVTGAEEESRYKVDGSSVFNAVVQMCVLDLQPAIKRFLRMPVGSSADKILPQKCKKWNKVKSHLKSYLQDLLKLMGGVSSPHVVGVLLKHLHQMAPFVSCFPVIIQKVLKRLINIWASGEETTRIVAFLCIVRLCSSQRSLLDSILKQMYLSYVSNAKFVSPNTLPGINFMRRSLVEVYRLDEVASYQHVFLYVRQLAIHLRNAITLQKQESTQAVLNWQYVHSLHLWAELLGATANRPALQPLLYPLVQVIIGTIKLIPTTQYFPLRFHCVQMLIDLSKNTNTFIPVLPFLLEVLSTYDFNRRPKKASMKPMDMTCVLRVSKTEQAEKSFKDATVEQIYRLMLQCLANDAHSIGFPDLVVAPVIQIKKFLKECKVANYCKKVKSILDKIEENARFVEKERKTVTLNLQDRKAVDAFETNLKLKGTPLAKYCASFVKVNAQVMRKQATDNDKLGDFNLPVLKKHKRKAQDDDGPADPFPSDDSDSEDLNLGSPEPENKKKKKQPKKVKKTKTKSQTEKTEDETREKDDQPDIVEDLRLEDF